MTCIATTAYFEIQQSWTIFLSFGCSVLYISTYRYSFSLYIPVYMRTCNLHHWSRCTVRCACRGWDCRGSWRTDSCRFLSGGICYQTDTDLACRDHVLEISWQFKATIVGNCFKNLKILGLKKFDSAIPCKGGSSILREGGSSASVIAYGGGGGGGGEKEQHG